MYTGGANSEAIKSNTGDGGCIQQNRHTGRNRFGLEQACWVDPWVMGYANWVVV
jgi:hypothetical protein